MYLSRNCNLSKSLLLIMLVFLLKLQRPTYLDIFIHSKGTLIGYPITTHVRTLTSFINARLNKIAYKNHDRKFLQSIWRENFVKLGNLPSDMMWSFLFIIWIDDIVEQLLDILSKPIMIQHFQLWINIYINKTKCLSRHFHLINKVFAKCKYHTVIWLF